MWVHCYSHTQKLAAFSKRNTDPYVGLLGIQGLLLYYCSEILSNLFEVLTEGYPKAAIPVAEHLACHQRVEHSCAGQWHTKVEAKQPPVLCIAIELQVNKHTLNRKLHLIPKFRKTKA